MQKKHFRTFSRCFLLLLLVLSISFAIHKKSSESDTKPAVETGLTREVGYFLLASDRHLVVTTQTGDILQILDIDPRTLPPADQKTLMHGIYVPDEIALESILQDFS